MKPAPGGIFRPKPRPSGRKGSPSGPPGAGPRGLRSKVCPGVSRGLALGQGGSAGSAGYRPSGPAGGSKESRLWHSGPEDQLWAAPEGDKDALQVLQMIKETLGLGNVIKQNTTKYRFVVQDKKGLELIVSLFNGNLVLPSRKIGFLTFLRAYNE